VRYTWWLVRCQPWRVLRGSLVGTAWMIGLAVRPYLIARAIDDGLRQHDYGALFLWVGAILFAGVALAWLGIMRHRTMTFVREDATARSAAVLLRHLSRVGAVLPRKLAAGEVATVGGSDIGHVSQVLTMTGPGVGAVIAYAVVAVVLWSVSPLLALIVVLGVPAIAGTRRTAAAPAGTGRVGLPAPAGHSHYSSWGYRGRATVLAGVGGRGLFARRYAARSQDLLTEGYRVGAVNSWIDCVDDRPTGPVPLGGGVAGGANDRGRRHHDRASWWPSTAMWPSSIVPVWFLLMGSYDIIRGRVAARRILAVLNLTPDEVDAGENVPAPADPADLHDPDTGLTVRAGRWLGVAADDPADAIALADRLGRFVASEVTWGGVPIAEIALDQVRARILVADHDSYLFGGTLRNVLCGWSGVDDAKITAAVRAASAEDVVDALPDGLATTIDTRARTLSGGERQRVRLARALLAEPDVLILVDPTSAVDAHTESRIAQRLREARAGRTTVVLATVAAPARSRRHRRAPQRGPDHRRRQPRRVARR